MSKKDKNACSDDFLTKISSNTRSHGKVRQRGRSITNLQSSSNPRPRKSSSSEQRTKQWKLNEEESNDGCVGDDGGEKPPHANLEWHIQCPNKKGNKSQIDTIYKIQEAQEILMIWKSRVQCYRTG
jgi:hypothetical protein